MWNDVVSESLKTWYYLDSFKYMYFDKVFFANLSASFSATIFDFFLHMLHCFLCLYILGGPWKHFPHGAFQPFPCFPCICWLLCSCIHFVIWAFVTSECHALMCKPMSIHCCPSSIHFWAVCAME